jgi:hypothetical protein
MQHHESTPADDLSLQREHVLTQTTFAHEKNPRSWLKTGIVALLAHIVLIAVLVLVTRRTRSAEMIRDVPVMRGVLGDTAGVSGAAPIPDTGPLNVSCRYVVAENAVARLEAGPRRSAGRLGCKSTLSLAVVPDWRGELKARYSSDGELAEIYDRVTVSGDSIVEMVQSWDLATPRPGRRWPGLPTFRLSVEDEVR